MPAGPISQTSCQTKQYSTFTSQKENVCVCEIVCVRARVCVCAYAYVYTYMYMCVRVHLCVCVHACHVCAPKRSTGTLLLSIRRSFNFYPGVAIFLHRRHLAVGGRIVVVIVVVVSKTTEEGTQQTPATWFLQG